MDLLVSTEWLAAHLGAGDLVVLDCSRHLPATGRDAAAEFAAGHVPGARFLDLAALGEAGSAVGHTLPGAARAGAVLGALGVTRASRIVLYDDSAIRSAARAWFILAGYGFASVALLDGGLARWRGEGRPLEAGTPAPVAGVTLDLPAFAGAVRRKADLLAGLASGSGAPIVDARDAGRFTGETEDRVHGLPGGHIPGARHLHYADLFAEDGTFLPRAALAARFAAAGIDPARPFVASCGSGVTASVLLFAAALLGESGGALYDGSWSEWGADPATPKQTGPAA